MKVEAINNILYNGIYRMPGTVFECDDIEAKRLIDSKVVTENIDPQMIKIAHEKLKKAIAERDQLEADLKKAKQINAKNSARIAEIEKDLESVKDKKEAVKLQKELKGLKNGMANDSQLEKELSAKDKEIDNYNV